MTEIERTGETLAMAGGEVRFLDLDLDAGDFLRTVVEQHGIDVALRLVGPEGEHLARIDSPVGDYGYEELVAIATAAGRYRLVVEAPDREGVRGAIVVRPPERRPASEEDRALVAADRAYREGRELAKEGRHEPAIERLEEALATFQQQGWGSREALAFDALALAHRKSGALQAAADCSDAALRLYRRHGHAHLAPYLLDRAGELRLRLGRAREAVERFGEAVDLFPRDAEPGRRAVALAHLANAQEAAGEPARARESFERALDAVGEGGGDASRAQVLAEYGAWLLGRRRPRPALDAYREAAEIYRRLRRHRPLALALSGTAAAALELGEVERGEEAIAEALERLTEPGDRRHRAVALNTLGNLKRRAGDLAAARAAYEEALSIAREVEDRSTEAVVLLDLGHLEVLEGEPQRGLAGIERAQEFFAEAGDVGHDRVARVRAAEALRDLGRLDEAYDRLEPVLDAVEMVPRAEWGNPEADLRPTPMPRPEHLAIAIDVLRGLDALEPGREHRRRAFDLNERRLLLLEGAVEGQAARLPTADGDQAPGSGSATASGPIPLAELRQEVPEMSDDARKRPYDPIEPPEEESTPTNPAHTDLPGPDDGPVESSAVAALERGGGESRRRRETAHFDLGPDKAGEPAARESIGAASAGDSGTDAEEIELVEPLDLTPKELGRRLVAAWRAATPVALVDQANLAREYEEEAREEIALRKSRRELPSTIDPHDLAETGWGVIVSRDEHPAVVSALRRLLERREEQAGARFRELDYQPGESARRFLWLRHGEAPGVLDPDVLPYYLLLVGGPESIPFEFQYDLAINHAVGRIAFDDPEDYRSYADAVLEAEDQGVDLPRRATIFSVENDEDRATALLAEHLVSPLAERLSGFVDWEVDVWGGEQAYRRDLRRLLGGDATPGLLLASCHGVKKAPGAADQAARQGALLCRDWPGNHHAVAAEHSFGGDDLDGEATGIRGLIAYLFACYGAGTPVEDNYPHEQPEGAKGDPPQPARELTPRPFVARLPQALLRSGALAVVGHVDRGWTTAFQWQFRQISAEAVRSLEDSLKQLLAGGRIGHTLRPLVRRYTAIAGQLAESMERVKNGEPVDEELVAFEWTAHNDARNLLLLGDPAVYLLGRRCWEGEAEAVGEVARVGLDPALVGLAEKQAKAAGTTLEEWINELLRQRLRPGDDSREEPGNDGA